MMPCYDVDAEAESRAKFARKASRIEALLCALSRVIDQENLRNRINFEEAGVTRKWYEDWWNQHKKEDEERQRRELEKAAREKLRRQARSKLTPEEIKALGL